jgi:hypothetical protein
MALTNFDIINICRIATNKDLEGDSVRTSEYQSLINAKSKLLFAQKLGIPEEYGKNAPVGRRGAGISRKNDEELRPFYNMTTVGSTGGVVTFPTDMGYFLAMNPSSITGRGFDELTADELADRMGDTVVAPTAKDPVYVWRDSTSAMVYPADIGTVTIFYYKYPSDAVIATTVNTTTLIEEYNAAGSTELEWNDEQKVEIAYLILKDLGVNLERQDVMALGQMVSEND